MTTTLTYLGHASFCFETKNAAVVSDPWLNPEGAFLGAWRQLPPNAHCLDWVVAKMKEKPTAIYITHEHEDHYDEKTLATLLPHAQGLFIPQYENTFLLGLMKKNLNATPVTLKENVPQKFHDIDFKIFIDESGINRDSAIFLKSADLSFLNSNDCKIFDRAKWLRKECGHVDILSCQFSGANMHPICYDIPEDAYREVSRQKRMRKFVAVNDYIRDLQPTHYIASAGPCVFSYEQHEKLNFEEKNIFPKWWEFKDFLTRKSNPVKFAALDNLGYVEAKQGHLNFHNEARKLEDSEIMDIIRWYRDLDSKVETPKPIPQADVFAFLVRELDSKIEVLQHHPEVKLGCPLYIKVVKDDASAVMYRLDPDRQQLEEGADHPIAPPYYLHTTSTDTLRRLMRSGKGWGTYFLSFLFRGKRDPDVFDTALGTFFVANDASELDFGLNKIAQFRGSDEYITLESSDGQSSVTCRRYCPHQGADLTYATFDGKNVICPRHQWRFNCENGGKADNSSDTLDATITRKQPACA